MTGAMQMWPKGMRRCGDYTTHYFKGGAACLRCGVAKGVHPRLAAGADVDARMGTQDERAALRRRAAGRA